MFVKQDPGYYDIVLQDDEFHRHIRIIMSTLEHCIFVKFRGC